MLRSLALEMLSAASSPSACWDLVWWGGEGGGEVVNMCIFGVRHTWGQYRVPRQQSTAWYLSIPPLLTFL